MQYPSSYFGLFQNETITSLVMNMCSFETWLSLSGTSRSMRRLADKNFPIEKALSHVERLCHDRIEKIQSACELGVRIVSKDPTRFIQLPKELQEERTVRKIACVVRRAAFDFGSGKIRVHVADVNTVTSTLLQTLLLEKKSVPLSDDAAKQMNGAFSEAIQESAIRTAHELQIKAQSFRTEAWSGYATEAYRCAPNGQALVNQYHSRLGIPTRIISQESEGIYCFRTLLHEYHLDPQKTVSWEIGGGSFQIAYLDSSGNEKVYGASLGKVTTKNTILRFIKGVNPSQISSPNPITEEEWDKAVVLIKEQVPQVPEDLCMRLRREGTELIGNGGHPIALRKSGIYSLDDIDSLKKQYLGKTDQELLDHPDPLFAVTELLFIRSIMEKLHVSSVRYLPKQEGSTTQILLDEKYWHQKVM